MRKIFGKIKSNFFMFSFWTLVFAVALVVFIHKVDVNDYYWHVKAGEYMAANGVVPKTGIFSWFALEHNLPWIAHEWLFEWMIYLVRLVSGDLGVFFYSLITSLILVFFLCWNARKDILNIYSALGFLWLGLGIFSVLTIQSARPHMLMFIFMSALVMLLYHYKNKPETKLIYLMPLISLVWANIHGGSSNMVYILPILFMSGHLFNFKFGTLQGEKMEKAHLMKLAGLTFISLLVIMVNPNGIHMISYPYVNMGDSLMLEMIAEWQSADIKNIKDLIFIFTPIILSVLVLSVKEKVKLHDLILFGFFTYLALRSVRFMYLIYFIQSITLFKDLPREKPAEKNPNLIPVFWIIIVGLLAAKALNFSGISPEPYLSENMIEVIKEESPERLLNHYTAGGYLIYHDIPVYIDGRADMYSKHSLRDYNNFVGFSMEEPDKFLEDGDFDYILMYKFERVNNYLKKSKDWEIIEEDESAYLYKRIK